MLSKDKLTGMSGNLVDFYNIAGLVVERSKNGLWGLWTHYSWRELFIRGGIITTTALAGVWAADTCQDEDCSSVARGVVGAGAGFFVSHAMAIAPIVMRRYGIKQDIERLGEEIKVRIDFLNEMFSSNQECYPLVLTIKFYVEQLTVDTSHLNINKKGDAVHNLLKVKEVRKSAINQLKSLFSELYSDISEEQQKTVLTQYKDALLQKLESAVQQPGYQSPGI